jgi:ubiquinone/menaquinone biosynthesis C-methylase UbiE
MKGSSNQTWDALASRYDAARINDPVYSACLDRVVSDLHSHGRVLDAGCGTGMATRLIGNASSIYAVDYSAASIDIVHERLPNVVASVADIRALPFQDNFFDSVLCANTLQHLSQSDRHTAVQELMRVLKTGGRYAISVHHFSHSKRRAGWIKEGKPGQTDVDYIFRFTRGELAHLLPNSTIRSSGFYGWPDQNYTSRIFGRLLARLGVGHMLIAFGKK